MPESVQKRRSSTAPYLRTEVKTRMRVLRERLPVDDQTLLVLRIDKGALVERARRDPVR
jgi:serine phosphatase RsbU (regulator of sigma subunit)